MQVVARIKPVFRSQQQRQQPTRHGFPLLYAGAFGQGLHLRFDDVVRDRRGFPDPTAPGGGVLADEVVRVCTARHLQHADIQRQAAAVIGLQRLTGHFKAAHGRILAGAVGIQRQHHPARQARGQQAQLRLGQRRAHLRHDVQVTGLLGLDDVHVAFYDHRPVFVANRPPRPVQAIEQAALVKERRLRRIQVLGLVLVRQGARAESDHPSAFIADGNEQAVAEVIVGAPALLVASQQTDLQQVLVAVVQLPHVVAQALPAFRRIAQRRGPQGLVAETAPLARVVQHLRRVPQTFLKPVRGGLQHAPQDVAARRLLPLLVALAPQLHAGLAAEFFQGLAEAPAMVLLGKAEQVPAFGAAAEATPALRIRIDDEGGRALAVKGAVGLVVAAGLLQRDVLLNVGDDVDAGFDLVSDGHGPVPDYGSTVYERAAAAAIPDAVRLQARIQTICSNCKDEFR